MKILSVCGDPGGANALSKVIRALEKEDGIEIINFTYHEGIKIFSQKKIAYDPIPKDANETWIKNVYEENKFELILSATSENQFNWEKKFIYIAKEFKIYTLSILDFWSNYASRYSEKNNDLAYLPDKIAVMDQRAKDEMILDNIPTDKILITGHTALDNLKKVRLNFTENKKSQWKLKQSISKDECLVTFVSQPLAALYGDGDNNTLGYDEKSVLNLLIKVLEGLAQQHGKKINLMIKPHPKENIQQYKSYKSSLIKLSISAEEDFQNALMSSDVVVGMTSMLLVEACYLQCSVISVQPNLKRADVLPTNYSKLSQGVFTEDELINALKKILVEKAEKENSNNFLINGFESKAVDNTVRYIKSLLMIAD